jgi:hypothetical protein
MLNGMKWVRSSLLVACCLSLVTVAWAAIPRTIHYQGKLTEPDGTPITGTHAVTFRLYDSLTGGTKLWEEQHELQLAPDDNGIFSIILGSQTAFSSTIDFNNPLWLSIEIDGGGEFSPRLPLAAVSYAINADLLDGLDASQFLTTLPANVSLLGPSIGSSELEADSVDANALSAAAIQPGDIEVGDLPAHASTHQPGGVDALATDSAVSVGSANAAGTSTSLARADHVHEGLHSLAASGQPPLVGDAVLAAGANVSLSQAGQTITIAASAAAGNRASTSSTSAQAISSGSNTTLLSVSMTKSQASSALLVIATVQLANTGPPTTKTVDVKLFRDGSQLDGSYTTRIGQAAETVRDVPVTIHAWDTSAAGTYTFSLAAQASGAGVQATVRRLTVIELP